MKTSEGLWPTPQAHDSKKGDPKRVGRHGTKHGGRDLADYVLAPDTLPMEPQESDQLTLLPEDSPARTSVTPANKPESTVKGPAYGQSSPVLLARYDLDTQSWRTSQRCLVETEADGFSEFLATWPRSGMTVNGIAYQLPTLALLTAGIESGSLPTPSATPYGSNQGGSMGRTGPVRHSLNSMAKHNLWPTPTSRDWKDGSAKSCANVPENGLLGRVATRGTETGSLNPQFVEWLMGYPQNWTVIEDE